MTSAYDAASRRTLRIDARGNRTTYTYDVAGRMTKRRYPNATRTTWTYDSQDNPLVVNATNGIFTRTFDQLNRVKQLIWPSADVYTWTYDDVGQRATRRASDLSPGRTTYAYDAVGRMKVLRNENSERTTYTYNKAGAEVRQLLANGTRVTTTYDGAGRTKSVRNYDSTNAVISLYTYTYDAAGNRLTEADNDAARVTYTYDFANQLTAEHRTGATVDSQTHVYDAAGNRTVHVDDGVRITFTYNAANRLRYSQAIAGRTTYTFDADGNQRTAEEPSGDLTTNTWSYENQLIQVELPDDSTITYTWAPVNRDNTELMLAREDDTGTVYYVYDAKNLIRELDETFDVQAEYTLNPKEYGDLISQRQDSDSYFHLFDAFGSTRQLIDGSQTEADNYLYSAFGITLVQTGATENHAQWIGKKGYRKDEVAAQHVLSERMYRSQLIEFLSQDPAQSDPNRYRYAGNSPTNRVDPSGLLPTPDEEFEGGGGGVPANDDSQEAVAAKTDLSQIPEATIYQLLSLDGVYHETRDGAEVVVSPFILEGRLVNAAFARSCKTYYTTARPGASPTTFTEKTFALVGVSPLWYDKKLLAETKVFDKGEIEAITGFAELLTFTLKCLPGGTFGEKKFFGEESETSDVELWLVTIADASLIGGLLIKGTTASTRFAGTGLTIARGAAIVEAGATWTQAGIDARQAINNDTALGVAGVAAVATAIVFGVAWKKRKLKSRVRTVEIDGRAIQLAIDTDSGVVHVMTNARWEGRDLILEKLHIGGLNKEDIGKVGVTNLKAYARQFGEEYCAKRVIIRGAERTTGRNPGSIPREIIVNVNYP